MTFHDLISTRRSIRKFRGQRIEKEIVEKLLEAALRSPSSRSINPWHFIVVDHPQTIQKLALAKPHGASFLKGAPLCIVVCADTTKSDVWVEDTSIASIFIHLAAHDLGLGSCWIQIRKREYNASISADSYVKDVLKIPDNIMIEAIVAIGYPDEAKQGHPKESLQFDKVSLNTYGLKG